MSLWLSRDSHESAWERIELWDEKPVLNGSFYELNRWRSGYILTEVLKKAAGLTLKPGELRRVKSIEIVLDDNQGSQSDDTVD